jgi:hypothetical protein
MGGRLGGQNGNMSRQLALLTQGGKVKPSIEEALDSKNLPFVEYCRKAKADDFGVIRIKNVSTFTSICHPVLQAFESQSFKPHETIKYGGIVLIKSALDSILRQPSRSSCFPWSQCQNRLGE